MKNLSACGMSSRNHMMQGTNIYKPRFLVFITKQHGRKMADSHSGCFSSVFNYVSSRAER